MEIIDNRITAKHKGKNPELEERLTEIRKELVGTQNITIPNGEEFLYLGHSPEYIEAIKKASQKTGEFYGTHFSPETYEVATRGVGASILGAKNEAFVLTRPPGHHAGYNLPTQRIGLGDCVFNNMAIASKYLRNKGKKVLVLDIDLHQGSGTQEILGDEEDIFVVDTHQKGYWPWYESKAKNCTNVQFAQGVQDNEYIAGLESQLIPILKTFRPDIIGVSAGFDANKKDRVYLDDSKHPNDLSYFNLTGQSFNKIKEILKDYPHFAILEGGYNSKSVKEGVDIFMSD